MTQDTIGRCFLGESAKLLDQSMVKILHCLNQLSTDQIWWRPEDSMNSIGNLALHMAGNLRQWTVVGIGRLPDDRDRAGEFAQRNPLPAEELSQRLEAAVADAKELFQNLGDHQLLEMRPIQDFNVTVLGAISHTTSHFVGHAHQIIQLTRLALGDKYQFHWSPAASRGDVPI